MIPCSDPNNILTDEPEALTRFLELFNAMGGKVDDSVMELIADSVRRNQVTVGEIERAVKEVFDKDGYRPSWSQILKRAKNPNDGVIDGGLW